MKYEIVIHQESGMAIHMPVSDNGHGLCPVCGEEWKNKALRPYDEMGYPSYGICGCGIEFGFDCSPDSTHRDWEVYRKKWLDGNLEFGNGSSMSRSEKMNQLKNIKLNY